MCNNLIFKCLFLMNVFVLSGCSSFFTADLDELSKDDKNLLPINSSSKPQIAIESKIANMQSQLDEWKNLKPSIERLVAIEGELKELMVQLNTMAETQSNSLVEDKVQSVSLSENIVEQKVVKEPILDTPITNIPENKTPKKFSVQLYSLTDKNALRTNWSELLNKHPNELSNLIPLYNEVVVNGTVFYRVKAGGFNSQTEANQLCAKLQAVKTPCFSAPYNGTPFL